MFKTRQKRLGLAFSATAMLVLLFVVLFALLSRSWYQVEVELDVPESTALRAFWTTPGSPFVVERSAVAFASPEKSTYRLVVRPEKKVFHLQFKMNEHISAINLRSLTVGRIGRKSIRLDSAKLEQRMFVVGGERGKIQSDGRIRFSNENAWLLVRIDSVHPGDKVSFAGTGLLLLIGSLIVGVACVFFLISKGLAIHWLSYALLFLGCFLISRWTNHLLPFSVFVWFWAIGLTLLVLRLIVFAMALKSTVNPKSRGEAPLYRAVLPAFFFGLIGFVAIQQFPVFAGFDTEKLFQIAKHPEARKKFNGFFEENFSFRDELIAINSEVKFSLLKSSPVQKMMVGRDGFVFEGRGERRVEGKDIRRFNNFADYMGRIPLTHDQLMQWVRVLEERRDYLERLGIAYVFAIAPTKNMIYPEKLPRRFQQDWSGRTRYDQLSEYLKKYTTIPFVDLRHALLEAKAKHTYPNLYYRVDFHWNYFGAFFAYREIVRVVNEHYPELGLQPMEVDTFSVDVQTDWLDRSYLRALGLGAYPHHSDQYVRMRPLDPRRFGDSGVLPESGVQDTPIPTEKHGYRGHRYSVKAISNPDGELSGAVIFGDSFIYKTMLYFSVHAKRTAFKRTVFEFPRAIIEGEKPKLLIHEILNMYLLNEPPAS